MTTLLIALLLFGLMIGIHEFGHLIAAKLNKVNVLEFSIGMGPKLFSFNKNGTNYSLRLLPIGGYCNMEGENEESENDGSFSSKSPLRKISILSAGAIMNLLLGFVALFVITLSSQNITSTYVGKLNESAPAYNQGIKENDKILKLNGDSIHTINDINLFMGENDGEDISVTVLRDNKDKLTFTITPFFDTDRYYIGFTPKVIENNFFESVRYSFYNGFFVSKVILKSLFQLITGGISLNEASGPVGVVKEIGVAAKGGFFNLVYILAIITINLGLFNLLPIPALDGGRIFFCLIELITRKKLSPKIESIIHSIGLCLLLLVMVFVTFNDVFKLFSAR